MPPQTQIAVPPEAMDRIAMFKVQEQAADAAAEAMMASVIADWEGKSTTLRTITQRLGNAAHIRNATRDVFMALTSEGMTYRDFTMRMQSPLKAMGVPKEVKQAIGHFQHVFSESHDLRSMGLDRGELLLAPFDWHVSRYLKAHPVQRFGDSYSFLIIGAFHSGREVLFLPFVLYDF